MILNDCVNVCVRKGWDFAGDIIPSETGRKWTVADLKTGKFTGSLKIKREAQFYSLHFDSYSGRKFSNQFLLCQMIYYHGVRCTTYFPTQTNSQFQITSEYEVLTLPGQMI